MNGGVISDVLSIILSSTGSLTLDNLTISAPNIQFSASSVWIGPGVSLEGMSNSFYAPRAQPVYIDRLSPPGTGGSLVPAIPPDFLSLISMIFSFEKAVLHHPAIKINPHPYTMI